MEITPTTPSTPQAPTSTSWWHRHPVPTFLATMVVVKILLMTVDHYTRTVTATPFGGEVGESPAIIAILSSLWLIGLIAGLPMVLYRASVTRENMAKQANVPQPAPSGMEKLRQAIVFVYGVCLAISMLFAVFAVFVFDGDSHMWARVGLFLSFVAIPICIGIAMAKSKKSLWWFLLPWFPFLLTFLFDLPLH